MNSKTTFSYNSFVYHMPIFHYQPQQNGMSHNGSVFEKNRVNSTNSNFSINFINNNMNGNNFVWTNYDFQKGSCNKTTNRNYNFKPSKIQKKKKKNKEIKEVASAAAVTITKGTIGSGCDLNKSKVNKKTTDKKNNNFVILKEEFSPQNHNLEQKKIRTSISIKELLN
ncbi:hypothetical protein ABK040_000925 [Willaertia magna]